MNPSGLRGGLVRNREKEPEGLAAPNTQQSTLNPSANAAVEILAKQPTERESLAAPGAFAGTAAVRCDVPSLGQSSREAVLNMCL